MGLFDVFTNDAATQAANANKQLYANNAANAGQLFSGYGTTANTALNNGVAGATGALDTGVSRASDALMAGQSTATTAGNNAVGAYAPLTALAGKYGTGTNLFLDALGANGASGTTNAQNAFTAGPGYNWQVGQALQGVENSAAARGGALSGNALAAVNDRASGLAKQEYGSWLDRLGGLVNPELAATTSAANGTAAGYKTLADIAMQGGTNLAGLATNDANARAGLATADAGNRVGVAGNVTSGLYNAGKDETAGLASANNAEAQAAQNGSATFWNGLFSLGGNAAKGFLGGPAKVAA